MDLAGSVPPPHVVLDRAAAAVATASAQQLAPRLVSETMALLADGNTIPFIARYR